ncbi:MAG: hypothetical protein ACI9E5_001382 [Candidatus Omnitrophota bacterium]|jgi:hypothetical protein
MAFGKTIIVIGIVLVAIGCCMTFLPKSVPFGKLPGDFLIKKENFTFYFPLTSCILVSITFAVILKLWK